MPFFLTTYEVICAKLYMKIFCKVQTIIPKYKITLVLRKANWVQLDSRGNTLCYTSVLIKKNCKTKTLSGIKVITLNILKIQCCQKLFYKKFF